jgi:hypothetical protein
MANVFKKIDISNMTNRDFIMTRDREDFFVVNRMCQWAIKKKVGEDAPLWEKEKAYEEFMSEPLDWALWSEAKTPSTACYV